MQGKICCCMKAFTCKANFSLLCATYTEYRTVFVSHDIEDIDVFW